MLWSHKSSSGSSPIRRSRIISRHIDRCTQWWCIVVCACHRTPHSDHPKTQFNNNLFCRLATPGEYFGRITHQKGLHRWRLHQRGLHQAGLHRPRSISGFFAHILNQQFYVALLVVLQSVTYKILTSLNCYFMLLRSRIYSARISSGTRLVMDDVRRPVHAITHALSKRPESCSGFALLCRCACAAMPIASGRRHKQMFAHSISRFDWICQVVYRIPTGSSHWQCTLKWNVFEVFFVCFARKCAKKVSR